MKWLVCALALLGGCLGGSAPDTVGARTAADASHDAARGGHEYLLFLGVTGTEGPLNWTLYEEALREADDPGTSIADAFDQDVENGFHGDGLLGSWLTTHFVFDERKNLLGGLYTQYSDQSVHSIYAPFRGPYAGTLALPHLQLDALPMRGQDEERVLCGLTSTTAAWRIDSQEAAAIALQRPLLQQHVEAYPEAEFTYYYFPRLEVEAGCPGTLDVPSNHWTISHADLDGFLAAERTTVAEVRIDAATGEVLEESIRPLFTPPPVVVQETLRYEDPVLPSSQVVQSVAFPVKPQATRLDVSAVRTEAPSMERSAATQLVAPDGNVHEHNAFHEAVHWYKIDAPMAGTWRLEYVHEGLEPQGTHELLVRGVVNYA